MKICAKSEGEVTGMERYEEEKAEEEYEKHKCRTCVYAKWQGIYIVSCLFPCCVKDKWFEGVKRVLETLESE